MTLRCEEDPLKCWDCWDNLPILRQVLFHNTLTYEISRKKSMFLLQKVLKSYKTHLQNSFSLSIFFKLGCVGKLIITPHSIGATSHTDLRTTGWECDRLASSPLKPRAQGILRRACQGARALFKVEVWVSFRESNNIKLQPNDSYFLFAL